MSTIPDVLGQRDYRVLVVVDDSPDVTGAVERPRPRASGAGGSPAPPRRRSLGLSSVNAFRRVLASDADLGLRDGRRPVARPFVPARAGRRSRTVDVVIGSRYLHGVSVVNWPLHRIPLSAAANPLRAGRHGRAPVADCTSGSHCCRRNALGRIPLDRLASNGYAFLIETLHEALRRAARTGEVPIVFVERRHGGSKVSLERARGVADHAPAGPFPPARAIAQRTVVTDATLEPIDVAIVGGGVVGLAAACGVPACGHATCVIERLPRPGLEASTDNSNVVHAGIYYPA